MKKLSLTVLFTLLSISGAAFAQNAASGGITESTDPAKAAAVEQRARELASQQQSASQQTDTASDKSSAKRSKRHASKRVAKSGKNTGASSGGGTSDSSGSK